MGKTEFLGTRINAANGVHEVDELLEIIQFISENPNGFIIIPANAAKKTRATLYDSSCAVTNTLLIGKIKKVLDSVRM